MKILLPLSLLLVAALSIVCIEPQKTFYMSFPALSKRDSLVNLFLELDKNISTYENTYTDGGLGANFKVSGVKPGFYYKDHSQIENYLDTLRINVTMGTVEVGTTFQYEIRYPSSTKKGTAFARARLDPSYFTKNLTLKEGFLEWDPDVVPALTFSQFFRIQSSTPKLTDAELSIVDKMIDNEAGVRRLKTEIINEVNGFYGPMLKKHLNHQMLISSNSITYQYKKISLSLQNYAKVFKLTNGDTKGLQVFFIFGLDSNTENCTKLPTEFDDELYGGLQQIISFSTLRSLVSEAITKGLFDVALDTTWQVPGLQFYMGDLGNSVPYANRAPANDRFQVKCTLDRTRMDRQLNIARHDEHDIIITVPETCVLNYNGSNIIEVQMDVNMVVRLYGEENSTRAVVQDAGIFGLKYTSLDSNYKVMSQTLAKYSITEVVKGFIGKPVFGTGFPAVYRRFPVIRVLDDRIIFYDPSQQ